MANLLSIFRNEHGTILHHEWREDHEGREIILVTGGSSVEIPLFVRDGDDTHPVISSAARNLSTRAVEFSFSIQLDGKTVPDVLLLELKE